MVAYIRSLLSDMNSLFHRWNFDTVRELDETDLEMAFRVTSQ